jgi:TRAP-type C4-dicarboxylate transport system permease small subunit
MNLKGPIKFLVGWLDRVAVLALLMMMLTTTGDILLRSTINKPITGATELVELWLGASFFFAAPGVFARGANIAVDMIDQWLPSWSGALKRISAVLAVVTLAVLTWHMWKPMLDILSYGDTSADLQIPKIWYMAPAWLGIMLSTLVSIAVLLDGEIEAVGGGEVV